ncbi:MAG: hypothetical protein KatS3mg115_2160 [Candidatus Poribacteria bacterium]|nr:MAG: hypothetical protein KatS3mg115_2160 [Candidatus Poribacteria bacterium]
MGVIAGIVVGLLLLGWGGFWLARRLILTARQESSVGYRATPEELTKLVGMEGVTKTPLRPVGVAEIGGRRYDVVTDGEYLAAGTPVRVIEVEGTRVLVRPVHSLPNQEG